MLYHRLFPDQLAKKAYAGLTMKTISLIKMAHSHPLIKE